MGLAMVGKVAAQTPDQLARPNPGIADGLPPWTRRRAALIYFLLALLFGTAARIRTNYGLPLWIDETFTATIASQTDVASLVRWCLTEITGPAFYAPMWAWEKLAGSSDAMLRLPPAAISLMTPLIVARFGNTDRQLALLWGALCFLWVPAIAGSIEARAYPQILLMGCIQAIAFIAAVRSRSAAALLGWTLATAIAVLTHYYALVISGLQGMALIWVYRGRMLRFWWTFAPLLVASVWMVFHFRFMLSFASARVSGYSALQWTHVALIPMLTFGGGVHGFVVLASVLWTWLGRGSSARPELAERLLVWTGVSAVAMLFAIGFWKATLMPRYLTPAIPALLFGLALWARRNALSQPLAVVIGLWAMLIPAAAVAAAGSADERFDERRGLTIDQASYWLMEARPRRLYFLWSTPTGQFSSSRNLGDVASFFFRRSNVPVEVRVVRGGDDPSRAIMSAARRDPQGAMLWFSEFQATSGVLARLERDGDKWRCREFGGKLNSVLACRQRDERVR